MAKKFCDIYGRYKKIVDDYENFRKFLHIPLKPSLRINTLKGSKDDILNFVSDLNPVQLPFYDFGFKVSGEGIGNRIEHFLGLVYLQEVASMIPPLILDLKPGLRVLDLCAAPGSKTTQIAQHLVNDGLIVANDSNRRRLRALAHNLDRAGVVNTVITNYDGKIIGNRNPEYFDRVLIDAPCSAEGTLRQSRKVLYHWGRKSIERLSRIQIGLLISGYKALKKGGIIIYSTCTFAPEENELVVSYLLKKFPRAVIEPISIRGFKTNPGLTAWDGKRFDSSLVNTVRIYPHKNDTGGFYLARIRKN